MQNQNDDDNDNIECTNNISIFISPPPPQKQQQQAALMAAATAQGTYINPMAALATQIPHALNGRSIHNIYAHFWGEIRNLFYNIFALTSVAACFVMCFMMMINI